VNQNDVMVATEESPDRLAARGPLLEARNVTARLKSRARGPELEVLQEVSLEVARGQAVCVAGRSGSGKTTLLTIASGLMPPSSGTVHWEGTSVYELDDRERTQRRRALLGLTFQNGGLIQTLTALENIALPVLPRPERGTARERAGALLERVGLTGRGQHFPSQLSMGEQQRVGLARALLSGPALLIVDEPTASLDRRTAGEIIELLMSLREPGRAILLASHDEALIARADSVITLQ
jgi:ABC-type lipoprotein export system ATPase subunit